MFNRTKLCAVALALISLPLTSVQAETKINQPDTLNISPMAFTPTQQTFLDCAVPHAKTKSNQYGLWTSIMLAQAIIESNWGTSKLGSAPYNNLFGMKAHDSWTGQSVTFPTKEWDANSQQYVTVSAKFRAYDNYGDSFNDNAHKLRYGLTWNSNYYSGTWLENTNSYKDAAQWLQGRYATSPTYANTLINTIKNYNLAQYDPKVENIDRQGYVKYVPGYSIKVYTSYTNELRQETGTMLKDGTPIQIQKKITYQDGTAFYKIGLNQWIPAQYAGIQDDNSEVYEHGVVRVKYVPGYSIAVWNCATNDREFTGQKLGHGTDWEYFSKVCIDGTTWYNVGRNQWIDGTYATIILN